MLIHCDSWSDMLIHCHSWSDMLIHCDSCCDMVIHCDSCCDILIDCDSWSDRLIHLSTITIRSPRRLWRETAMSENQLIILFMISRRHVCEESVVLAVACWSHL